MTTQDYQKLIAEARASGQAAIELAKERFDLGSWNRFDVDLSAARIHYFDAEDSMRVEADIQVAGTWLRKTKVWLWSWDDEDVPLGASERLAQVRVFGAKEGVETLGGSFEPCDEDEAWSMASIAAQILGAECIYRVPRKRSYVFLLLFSIRKCGAADVDNRDSILPSP